MTDNGRMTSKEDNYQATFSKEGRLLIPKALREALSVNAGDVVVLKVEKGELRIAPKSKYLKDLKKKPKKQQEE